MATAHVLGLVAMYEARAVFTLKSCFKYQFDKAIELDGARLETKDGKICGEVVVQVEKADPNLIAERALEKANKIASLLTLLFGEGFALEDVPRPVVVIRKEGHVVETVIYEFVKAEAFINMVGFSEEILSKKESELKELSNKLDKLSKLERGEDLLRAIKWWAKGYLEEDEVDKFLDYYIALEMLASIRGYKDVKKFSEDYSTIYTITYEPDGEVNIKKIRNRLMHEPGPDKDKAEKLAKLYADRLGAELLRAIKKVIDEVAQSSS